MKILVVDDEQVQREMLKGFLEKQGYQVLAAGDGAEALDVFGREPVDVVLLDHRMPGMTGDQVLKEMKALNPLVRVVMITAYGEVGTAVTVLKLGALDFLSKPVDLEHLLAVIASIEQSVEIEAEAASVGACLAQGDLPLHVIAESPGMKEVLSLTRRVAVSPWTVLVKGETGTGKELVAQLIHEMGPRREQPFVEVNCAAIPENLFESELFGHERGAFTGATATRRGRFELAQGGTLFLDEVGELPASLQPKLLRAIQEKRVCRVGGEQDIEVDVRLIAATNRDLKNMVERARFREDLYYRLNVLELEIPPLRHRREDIPPLVDFFLNRFAIRPVRLARETLDILIKYPYPGNVRELEHILQRTVTFSRGSIIKPADLPAEVRQHRATSQGSLAERLEALEREMILGALEKHEWVQTRAADSLGISERVLRYKMGKHGISRAS